MKRIDLAFLSLAAISLVVGVGMGIAMGAMHDFTFAPVHAHLNLLGWTSLALFGLVHRAYPDLAGERLSRMHLALAAPSALLAPAGIAVAVSGGSPALAIGGALLWLAGCVLFMVQVIRMALRGGPAPAAAR